MRKVVGYAILGSALLFAAPGLLSGLIFMLFVLASVYAVYREAKH